jgi:hypothetical protein
MVERQPAVTFDSHMAMYRQFLRDDPARDAYWYRKAEYLHLLVVRDAINHVMPDAVRLAERVRETEAFEYFNLGVARRAKFIWLSLNQLLDLIPPDREKPLSTDETFDVALCLNVIYVNTRGTLDNFAHALTILFGEEKTKALPPFQIDLFGNRFRGDPNLVDVDAFVKAFEGWNKDLKNRRDPAAHRIPLSVPPTILNNEDLAEYQRLYREYDAAHAAAFRAVAAGEDRLDLFEQATAVFERLEQVGTFVPVFLHHPKNERFPVYPTVIEDVGTLVKIARGLIDITSRKLDAAAPPAR